jgi:hypothetical protein
VADTFKVWLDIERCDEAKDQYETVDCLNYGSTATFKTLPEAKQFADYIHGLMTGARTVYAFYWHTRHGDQGIELHETAADAWRAAGEMIDVSDMTERQARKFWGLLDKGDDDSLAEFRREFYKRLGPTGHDVLIDAVELPGVPRG